MGAVNARYAQDGESAGRKTCNDHIIAPAGTVADQELARAVSSHHQADMRSVRVQGHIAGQSCGLGHSGQVRPHIPMPITGQPRVAERPVQKA